MEDNITYFGVFARAHMKVIVTHLNLILLNSANFYAFSSSMICYTRVFRLKFHHVFHAFFIPP